LPAAGWRRALEEACGGEAEGKGRTQEERRLAARELRRRGHQLLEVLFPQSVREMLNLTCGRVHVLGDLPLILAAHLPTGVMERRRDSIQSASQTLLLQTDLRGRLLASRIDELHGLVLRLANDLGPLTAQTGATAHAGAAAGPL